MEYKLFDTPHSHDRNFYDTREMADHINQSNHRPRLLQVADEIIELSKLPLKTIGDFGCGNGGLLEYLKDKVPQEMYGYDLQQSNVDFAIERGRPVTLRDFINEEVEYPDILIVSETLEHLPDPHGFLRQASEKSKYVVASTPGYETPSFHAPFHLWVWTDDSFKDIFEGWEVTKFYKTDFQFVVGKSCSEQD